jgi:hypothetical protein
VVVGVDDKKVAARRSWDRRIISIQVPRRGDPQMYQLLHSLTSNDLFKRQLPVFVAAFAIAEFFYKFGSFALECVAFLATWYVLDAVVQIFVRRKRTSPDR